MRDVKAEFGINAGKVWKALDSHGPLTKNQLMEHTTIESNEFHAAVGWLAKENKIRKDGEFFQLDETNLNAKIVEDAGKIWGVLDIEKRNMNHLSKLTQMKEEDVYMALGWLAKEGKLDKKDDKVGENGMFSVQPEIGNLNEEIDALNADLATRNMIIKEITEQLTERQTQFMGTADAVERLNVELDQNKNDLITRAGEASSAQLDTYSLREEIDALNADLATRNMIIKEITEQLAERQTQFMGSTGTIEELREEIRQNKNRMKLMSDKLSERINNVSSLQKELEKNHTTPEPTASTLFSKGQPLVRPEGRSGELNLEKEFIDEINSFEEIDKSHDISEGILKSKKSEIDEL
ncbi:MAG: winged helix-turn-helix domain-containing protein [Candidatus Thermoplasmatota archaeon]|nr:winged helix-turn-helix domain-containing protein [Candidatus Thermoplasmatota archaeon]